MSEEIDQQQQEQGQQPPAKKSNTLKYVGIGCGVLLVGGIVAAFLAYLGIKNAINNMVNEYTAEQAVELPKPPGDAQAAQGVITRVDAFMDGVNTGNTTTPLSLTADDINLLINFHPGWKELAGAVFVTIDDDKLSGEVSLPMGKFIPLPLFEGRYLNGSATISLELKDDRFMVFLEAIEANGQAVPEEVMSQLRAENLAKDLNRDPNMKGVFEKLKSISVKDGKIILVPKAAAGATQGDAGKYLELHYRKAA